MERELNGLTVEEKLSIFEGMDWWDKLDDLRDYAEMEDTETGEYWRGLVMMANSSYTYGTEEFQKAFEEEIDEQLLYAMMNTTIMEEETEETRRVTRVWLKWNNE